MSNLQGSKTVSRSNSLTPKVLVLGLDCADLALIKRWKADLPNLAKIMDHGAYGVLRSSVPHSTCPAWNCMTTGKNPGKIGVFGFLRLNKDGSTSIVNSRLHDSPAIWDILGDHGLRIGVLNVPGTYPPSSVNGFMVTGLLTPTKVNYTYPPEIASELDREVSGYVIEPVISSPQTMRGREIGFLDAVESGFRKRLRAAKYLMHRNDWSFFMVVFRILDLVQHHFWPCKRTGNSLFENDVSGSYGAIKHCYEMVDDAVGELSLEAGEKAHLVAVSDHGAAPLHFTFFVNEWLLRQNLLKIGDRRRFRHKGGPRLQLRNLIITNIPARMIHAIMRLAPRRLVEGLTRQGIMRERVEDLRAVVDWSRTKAYSLPGFSDGIFINRDYDRDGKSLRSAKDYEKIREQVIRKLRKNDCVGAFEVSFRVWKREEVYHGKHLQYAPDILFEIETRQEQDEERGEGFSSAEIGTGRIWGRPPTPGGHKSEGVWMIKGPGIKKTRLDADIVDLVPTILHIFNIPIPPDLDGTVLNEVFEREKTREC